MMPPTYRKEVLQFKGLVDYYRYMWARQSHKLEILTKITSSTVKFKWTEI